ncbi:MAG: transcription elongation GreA/GreB family factor [Myxococcota bacterium]|jgi:transcription elongation GreA/GreB family factor
MNATPYKIALHQAVLDALETAVAAIVASQKATMDGATHAESKQEGSKDTRAIEAGYLARGLAERAEALQGTLGRTRKFEPRNFTEDDRVSVGAAVELEDAAGTSRHVYLLPSGGGMSVEIEGQSIAVVTPKSPLGAALVGREVGDEFEFRTPRSTRRYEVCGIR